MTLLPQGRRLIRPGMVAVLVFLVLLILAVALAFVEAQQPPVTVDMRDFAFEPRDVLVASGTSVRWVNRDDFPHSVVMEGGRPGGSRGTIPPGGEHTFVFMDAGRSVYRCGVHPTMLGEITVAGQ